MRLFLAEGGLGKWALDDLAANSRSNSEGVSTSDVLIGADRGALYLLEQGMPLHAAIGDFDSVTLDERSRIEAEAETFLGHDAYDKDQTDTEMAFQYALGLKSEEIVLYGALGTRMDHSLANVHLLSKALDHGIPCRIVDEHNEIS